MRAFKRSTGEYLILSEDDWYAKIIMYRWRPQDDTLSKNNLVKYRGKFFNTIQNLIGSSEMAIVGEFAWDHNATNTGAHGGGKTAW